MYLIKTKKSPFYQMIYEVDGKRTSISTKTTYKVEARKFMNEFYREKIRGKVLKDTILLSKFKDEYESYIYVSKSPKYYKSVVLSLRQLLKYTGDLYLHELTSKKLEEFILNIYGRAKSAAHLYYRTLKAAFSKAIDWEYIVDNPLKKVKPPKVVKKYPKIILKKEFNLILKNTENIMFKNLFITAHYTGMRVSELVNMKYSWLNFSELLITIKNDKSYVSKSKRDRIIPMTITVYLALLKNEVSANEYVFQNSSGHPFTTDYISKKFKRAVRRSNLDESIHFHSLRHTFASMLAKKGVSLIVIKELLGHEDIKTTQLYSHLHTEDLTKAMSKL